MSILAGIIIAVIVVGILLVAGFLLHLFQFEKQDARRQDAPRPEYPVDPLQDDYYAEPLPLQEEEAASEMVDLFTYFNEEEEEEESQEAGSGDGDEDGEAAVQPVEEEESAADYDRLSNFKHGRVYIADCQKRLAEAREKDVLYAAVWFDVDRFRFINSLKGYSIGDFILTRLAQEMAYVFPETALCSRVSADHFTAVFPVAGDSVLEEYNDGLRRTCEKIRTDVGLKSSLRICMGMAVTKERDLDYDAEVLLQKANIARHCIKASRTESCQMYDDNMARTFLYGESAMEDYSENQYGDEFTLYYQPVADLSRNRVVASDVLVRWVCEEDTVKEVVTPESGRIPTNGLKVIYHACRAMSRWRKMGKEILPVYVPLPAIEFYKEDIDEFLIKCLSEFQLEPRVIRILVDVSVMQVDMPTAFIQMNKLRAIGLKVGLTGIDASFTGLGFLQEYPVDFIKTSRSLVYGLEEQSGMEALITKFLEDADIHHVPLVFEGVDNQEQVNILQSLGATRVQGRYCGSPSEGDEFMRTLPEYLQPREPVAQSTGGTVILDDEALFRGDFHIY